MVFGTERLHPDTMDARASKQTSPPTATTAAETSFKPRSGRKETREEDTSEGTRSASPSRSRRDGGGNRGRRNGELSSRRKKEGSLELLKVRQPPPHPQRKLDPCLKIYHPLPRGMPSQVVVASLASRASSVSDSQGSIPSVEDSEGDNDGDAEYDGEEDDIYANDLESKESRQRGILEKIFGRSSNSYDSNSSVGDSAFCDLEDTTDREEVVNAELVKLFRTRPTLDYRQGHSPPKSTERKAQSDRQVQRRVFSAPVLSSSGNLEAVEAEVTDDEDMECHDEAMECHDEDMESRDEDMECRDEVPVAMEGSPKELVSLPTSSAAQTTPTPSVKSSAIASLADSTGFLSNLGERFTANLGDMWGVPHPWVNNQDQMIPGTSDGRETSPPLSDQIVSLPTVDSTTREVPLEPTEANEAKTNNSNAVNGGDAQKLVANHSLDDSLNKNRHRGVVALAEQSSPKNLVRRFFGRQTSSDLDGSVTQNPTLPKDRALIKLFTACRVGGDLRAKEEAALEEQYYLKRTIACQIGGDSRAKAETNLEEQHHLERTMAKVQSEYKTRTASERSRMQYLTAEESLLLDSWRRSKSVRSNNTDPTASSGSGAFRSSYTDQSLTSGSGTFARDSPMTLQSFDPHMKISSSNVVVASSKSYASHSSALDVRKFASTSSVHSKSTVSCAALDHEIETSSRTSLLAKSKTQPKPESPAPRANNRSNRWSKAISPSRRFGLFGGNQDDKKGSVIGHENHSGSRSMQATESAFSKKSNLESNSAASTSREVPGPIQSEEASSHSSKGSRSVGKERDNHHPTWAPIETVRSQPPQIDLSDSSRSTRSASYVDAASRLARLSATLSSLQPEEIVTSFDLAMQAYTHENFSADDHNEVDQQQHSAIRSEKTDKVNPVYKQNASAGGSYTGRISRLPEERTTSDDIRTLGDRPLPQPRSKALRTSQTSSHRPRSKGLRATSHRRPVALEAIRETEEEKRCSVYQNKLDKRTKQAAAPGPVARYHKSLWGNFDDDDYTDAGYDSTGSISLDAFSALS